MKDELITIITQEVNKLLQMESTVPVGVSARHVHLSESDFIVLFGSNASFEAQKMLSQPGQYASNCRVSLVTDKAIINNVRVLGPFRAKTQVEISYSDSRKLNIKPPVRASGDFNQTCGIKIVGPNGFVELASGVMIAERHVHLSTLEAKLLKIKPGDSLNISVDGNKPGTFNAVPIRIHDNFRFELHVDTDDACAFLLTQGQKLAYEVIRGSEVTL